MITDLICRPDINDCETRPAEVLAFLRDVADAAEIRLNEIADGSLRLTSLGFDYWKEHQRIKRFRRRLREMECAGKDANLAGAVEYAHHVGADLIGDAECTYGDD